MYKNIKYIIFISRKKKPGAQLAFEMLDIGNVTTSTTKHILTNCSRSWCQNIVCLVHPMLRLVPPRNVMVGTIMASVYFLAETKYFCQNVEMEFYRNL